MLQNNQEKNSSYMHDMIKKTQYLKLSIVAQDNPIAMD